MKNLKVMFVMFCLVFLVISCGGDEESDSSSDVDFLVGNSENEEEKSDFDSNVNSKTKDKNESSDVDSYKVTSDTAVVVDKAFQPYPDTNNDVVDTNVPDIDSLEIPDDFTEVPDDAPVN